MSDADVKMPEPAAYQVQGFDEAGTLYARILHTGIGEARESASAFAQHYPKVTTTALVTADQLRAAILAERERCAKVCEAESTAHGGVAAGPMTTERGKLVYEAMAAGAKNCAAAIREGDK